MRLCAKISLVKGQGANVSYSMLTCLATCYLRIIEASCHCSWYPYFPGSINRTAYDGKRFCRGPEDFNCKMLIEKGLETKFVELDETYWEATKRTCPHCGIECFKLSYQVMRACPKMTSLFGYKTGLTPFPSPKSLFGFPPN